VSSFLDRAAFEALVDGNDSTVFNVCLRVAGSRDLAATATKAAFLDLLREHAAPVGLLAAARRESATLMESAGGGQAAARSPLPMREANGRLELRSREVLALRELAGCSYQEIARIVDADREDVAERLWRARLELRDALRASRLLAIAAVGKPCRRALPLMAMDWDGELHGRDDRHWLQRHLRTCGKCRVSQEAAREASVSYRAWPPAVAPMGMRESLLGAAEGLFATGAAERPAAGSETSSRSPPGSPPPSAPRGARRSPG
jgi:predicted DNA-binding protein (UPF0251 family)